MPAAVSVAELPVQASGAERPAATATTTTVNARQVGRRPLARKLSNGCRVTLRGIPKCGIYVGGAYGANSKVGSWQRAMGGKLGVHRTYYGPGEVNAAVAMANNDVRHRRVPWISFKAPYSWPLMAQGRGDAWAATIAARLREVKGPVWVAVHHEPENDNGDHQQWRVMQERLAPIMRSSRNVAFTVILMGYHQFKSNNAQFSLASLWPRTKVDIAGFDIYESYGKPDGGSYIATWTPFEKDYYAPISKWAKSVGAKWAIGETGYSNPAAGQQPQWPAKQVELMQKYDGIALSYFNSPLNSVTDWTLSSPTKLSAFAEASALGTRLKGARKLPKNHW